MRRLYSSQGTFLSSKNMHDYSGAAMPPAHACPSYSWETWRAMLLNHAKSRPGNNESANCRQVLIVNMDFFPL